MVVPTLHISSSPSIQSQDLCQLKLRKALLAQQLAVLDGRVERVARVLEHKKKHKNHNTRDGTKLYEGKGVAPKTAGHGPPAAMAVPPINHDTTMRLLKTAAPVSKDILQRRQHQLLDKVRRKREAEELLKTKQEEVKAKAKRNYDQRSSSSSRSIPRSFFPGRYDRGELPCAIIFKSTGKALTWMCPLDALDMVYYLPIFIDGIRCKSEPHRFISHQGCHDLIEATAGHPERIVPCLADIVKGLRMAMATRDDDTLRAALKVLTQLLGTHAQVGTSLVPYYKIFLPVLSMNYEKYSNLGDRMDYKQQDLGDAVGEVLELLEATGGKDAFANIKSSVPLCK